MADPTELMLADLSRRYADTNVSYAFLRLYESDDRLGRAFASIHERLNEHFESINDRAETTGHYWAEQSREMIALIKEVNNFLALVNIRSDPHSRRFYDRKRAEGKRHVQAVLALARRRVNVL